MRNLRNIALAGATAVALTFGSTSVAIAEDANAQTQQSSQQGGSLANKIGKGIFKIEGAETESDTLKGREIFGTQSSLSEQPVGAKLLYSLTVILGAAAVLGMIIAPIDNFIKYGPHAK